MVLALTLYSIRITVIRVENILVAGLNGIQIVICMPSFLFSVFI
jgi:hypothetical protein